MPSFLTKRKDKLLIPPVEPGPSRSTDRSAPPRSSYHSSANTYVPSRDGADLYVSKSKADAYPPPDDEYSSRDKYNRNNAVGDVYSRGDAQLDQDRNELFAGYNPEKGSSDNQGRRGGSGRFFDGPETGREPPPGEENDEDVEGIKQQTRYVKQESVNSTRNALRLAREAEETARNTLTRLGDQSGALCPW